MRNIPVKSPGNKFYSYECNDMAGEEENLILSTGISLSQGDLYQMGKSVANYICSGDYYTDTGSVNNYILAVITPKQAPTSYIDGFRARFTVANTNTAASQINVSGLGIKFIKDQYGNDLIGGELVQNQISELVYNGTNFVIFHSTQNNDIGDDILKMQYPYNGLLVSNNIANPNTHLEISTGWFIDSAYNNIFSSPTIFTKNISAVWAAGTGNGGRASAISLDADKFYHYFALVKADKTLVDFGWDDDIDATNLLADATGYPYYRYICSTKTDGSSNLHEITNIEIGKTRYMMYKTPILDINTSISDTLGHPAVISTPLGIKTLAICNFYFGVSAGGNSYLYISSLDSADLSPSTSLTPLLTGESNGLNTSDSKKIFVLTDILSQIRYRVSGQVSPNFPFRLSTLGWSY